MLKHDDLKLLIKGGKKDEVEHKERCGDTSRELLSVKIGFEVGKNAIKNPTRRMWAQKT